MQQFDLGKSNQILSLDTVNDFGLLATATSSSSIQFLDYRTNRFLHDWKVSSGITGSIRVITTSKTRPHILAIGFSSGTISLFDCRIGFLMGHWKAHETEITNLYFHESRWLCSVAENQVLLWEIDGAGYNLEMTFRAPTDVVAIAPLGDQLLAIENNNHLTLPVVDFSVSSLFLSDLRFSPRAHCFSPFKMTISVEGPPRQRSN